MANRFYSPNQQFADNTGLPYAGGSLAFYASGTSTPLATYSDSALTIANTNPVVLDSAGRAGNIFLQNLAYKVVLSDANNNIIWTDDPVFSSDYSARAKFLSGSGSPNGTTAGTAGSSGIGADSYWDTTNNILYICTTTGTSTTAIWTAVNSSTAAAVVPPPQGRLTLTSGTPVLSGDVSGATAVLYTPYVGNLVPIYNGSSLIPTVFSELTLTLASQHVANTIYDVFAFNNSGVVTLITGPAWSSSALGSGSRGTGAGTTQLSRLNGILVNTIQITARNGANTYTVGANLATYLGSILIDGSAGQVSCLQSYGQSRVWGVWNAYNREPIVMQGGDPTSSWTHAGGAITASNGNTANALKILTGLAEEAILITGSQRINSDGTTSSGDFYSFGVGVNTSSAQTGNHGSLVVASGTQTIGATVSFTYNQVPGLGANSFVMTERSANATTGTFFGTIANMVMTASYRG